MVDLPTNQNSSLAQNVFITFLNYGHWLKIFVCKHITLWASTHLLCWPTWSSLAKYAQTKGIHSSSLSASMIFLLQAWSIWHFCLKCMTLRACTQLIIERKEVVCCLLQVVKVIPLDHSSNRRPLQKMLPHLHQNTIPQWKHQTQSSKEKNCHHQKRMRLGKHCKAKVCVSNHICLKQDKTPQH